MRISGGSPSFSGTCVAGSGTKSGNQIAYVETNDICQGSDFTFSISSIRNPVFLLYINIYIYIYNV